MSEVKKEESLCAEIIMRTLWWKREIWYIM